MRVLVVLTVLCVAVVAADTQADLARALRTFLNKRTEPAEGVYKPDEPPAHDGEGIDGPEEMMGELDDPLSITLFEILDRLCKRMKPKENPDEVPRPEEEPPAGAAPARRELSLLARVLQNVANGDQRPEEKPERKRGDRLFSRICQVMEKEMK